MFYQAFNCAEIQHSKSRILINREQPLGSKEVIISMTKKSQEFKETIQINEESSAPGRVY